MSPDLFKKWEHLVEGIEKQKIPVEFISKLLLRMNGRRRKTINVANLVDRGLNPDEIEEEISSVLEQYDEDIISIEFILDIEGIAEVVQPETDEILRGL